MALASIPSPARSAWHLGPLPIRAQAACVAAGIILVTVLHERIELGQMRGRSGLLTQ